jgi:hypothetical protein
VLAGVITDCATITMAANGTTLRNNGMINIFNVPNVVVQNLRFNATGQSNAQACTATGTTGCNYGLRYAAANGYFNGALSGSTTTIQNLEVIDIVMGIFVSGSPDLGDTNPGLTCGVTIQDNYVHGSTISVPNKTGIVINYATNCATVGVPSATYTSNYTNNMGGETGDKSGSGNGILAAGGVVNVVDLYNVTANGGYNSTSCGSGYGNWWYQAKYITAKGNESYNYFPRVGANGGCDVGAFDFDNGTSQGVFNFNYAHESWGPSIGLFSTAVQAYPMGPNTVAYNLFENGSMYSTQGFYAMFFIGTGSGGPVTIYNNVLWNGYNGTNDTTNGNYVKVAAVGVGACPPGTSSLFANNILVANYAAFGFQAQMGAGSIYTTTRNCKTINWKNNDYYPLANHPTWINMINNSNFTGVPAWNAASGDTGIQTNPNFAGGGAGTTCYSGTGIPVNPGGIPCPINYQLQTGSTLIGTGLNVSSTPYNLPIPATDYFTNAIPNGVGTGFNYGADGAHH